jgi:hypothetical protein
MDSDGLKVEKSPVSLILGQQYLALTLRYLRMVLPVQLEGQKE